MSRVMGIDPGLGGAIAVLDGYGELVSIHDMPVVGKFVSPQLLNDLILDASDDDYPTAVIEAVASSPQMGVTSAFNFGRSYGTALGVLAGAGVRTERVSPVRWKRAMGLTSDKEQARQRALERWPNWSQSFKFKKNADRAEAALIALWWIEHGSKP